MNIVYREETCDKRYIDATKGIYNRAVTGRKNYREKIMLSNYNRFTSKV